MYLIPKEDTYKVKPLSELGKEFYDDITEDYLFDKIHKLKLPIKTILLKKLTFISLQLSQVLLSFSIL